MEFQVEEIDEFFTTEELAKLCKIPEKWVRNNSCRIAGYTKIGHHVRYRRSSVLAALAGGNLLRS